MTFALKDSTLAGKMGKEENESLLDAARKRSEKQEMGRQVVSQMEESLSATINDKAATEIKRLKNAFVEYEIPKIFLPLIDECVSLICKNESIATLERRQRIVLYNPKGITKEQLAKASFDYFSKDLIPCIDVLLQGKTNDHRKIALVFQFKSQTLTCFGGDFMYQYPYDSAPEISIVTGSDEQGALKFVEAVVQELDKRDYVYNSRESSDKYDSLFSPGKFDKYNHLLLTGGKYRRSRSSERDYDIFGEKTTGYFE